MPTRPRATRVRIRLGLEPREIEPDEIPGIIIADIPAYEISTALKWTQRARIAGEIAVVVLRNAPGTVGAITRGVIEVIERYANENEEGPTMSTNGSSGSSNTTSILAAAAVLVVLRLAQVKLSERVTESRVADAIEVGIEIGGAIAERVRRGSEETGQKPVRDRANGDVLSAGLGFAG